MNEFKLENNIRIKTKKSIIKNRIKKIENLMGIKVNIFSDKDTTKLNKKKINFK